MTAMKDCPRAPLVVPTGNVAPFIRELAALHSVSYIETAGDGQANDFARLSDCDVEMDEIEWLLVALVRNDAVSRDERAALHDAYLRNDLGLE